jgi:hypothetical protein
LQFRTIFLETRISLASLLSKLPKKALYLQLRDVFVSQMKMKAVVLAEMLREILEAKINKTRIEIRDTTMPIEVDRLEAQIMAYQWVQARLQDLVINNEDKDTKIRI